MTTIFDQIKADREAGDLCPFCRRDPFHRVDNGVGMEAVAVNCCDYGAALIQDRDEILAAVSGRIDQLERIALAAEEHLIDALEAIERGDDSSDGMAADVARGAITAFREACK